MTRPRILFSCFMLIALFSSCQKESTQSSILDNETQKQLDFLVDKAGYKKDYIEVTDDFFIIDHDMVFPRKNFWEDYGDRPELPDTLRDETRAVSRQHYAHKYVVNRSGTFDVNVDPNIPKYWHYATKEAIKAWNGLNGSIRLRYNNTNQRTYTGINVNHFDIGYDSALAWADRPRSNGYPGSEIYLNQGYNGSLGSLTYSNIVHTMIHELGHTIGFDHTDFPYYEDESWKIFPWYRYCSGRDNNSVMKAQNLVDWHGFSYCDKEAFYYLF